MNLKKSLIFLITISVFMISCSHNKETKEAIQKANQLYLSGSLSPEGIIDSLDYDQCYEMVVYSQKQDFGSEDRLHAILAEEIFTRYKNKIALWTVKARTYFVSLGFATPSQLNVDPPNKTIEEKAMYDNTLPRKPLIVNEDLSSMAKKMLIVCASKAEMNEFVSNLGADYERIDKLYGCHLRSNDRFVDVVLLNGQSWPDRKYGIIELKGHTGDMPRLLEKIKPHIKDNSSVVVLGGCSSMYYASKCISMNVLPFTNRSIGFATHNDYVARRLHVLLGKEGLDLESAINKMNDEGRITMSKFETPISPFTQRVMAQM